MVTIFHLSICPWFICCVPWYRPVVSPKPTVLDVATGALTGTVSSLSNHTTANLTEGSNLYFTNARADARIAAASIADLSDVDTSSLADDSIMQYNSSTGKFEFTNELDGGTV